MYNFNDVQIEKQYLKQIKFLNLIHPSLSENSYNDAAVELRPIVRDKSIFIKSLDLWRTDDKSKKFYIKFLKEINGHAVCLYYSAFTFEYEKEVIKADGKSYTKGKINIDNSEYTTILPMDFDNINMVEHTKYINILNTLGIDPLTVFTGHGYQDIILLSEKVYDKDIFKKFTMMLLSKGFPVDSKIKDSARVLRMPYSFNCKDAYNVIPTKLLNITDKRYTVEFIFDKLNILPTKDNDYFKSYSDLKAVKIDCNVNIPIDIEKVNVGQNTADITIKKSNYDGLIDFYKLPDAVQNILTETPDGLRNSALLFLIGFFRNKIGLPKDQVIEILKVWATNCKPMLEPAFIESEVNRLYTYDYKGFAYTRELAQKFGFIEFNQYKKDNKVLVSNEFINDYNVLNDGAVRIYLLMKTYEKIEDITEWTKRDICKKVDISGRTFDRYVNDLINLGYIDMKKQRKQESGYLYYINKFYNKSLGFTMFNTATLENMVYNRNRQLNNGEIKLYTYLCKMLNNNSIGQCYASQSFLGKSIGKARNSITRLTDSLCSKKYIKKDTYTDNYVLHCIYTLNY